MLIGCFNPMLIGDFHPMVTMARRSRCLNYDEQVNALMTSGDISRISTDKNHARGSVLERLKTLRAAEPQKEAEKTVKYNPDKPKQSYMPDNDGLHLS